MKEPHTVHTAFLFSALRCKNKTWEQNYISCEKESISVWKTELKVHVCTNTHKPTQYICEVSSNLAQLFTI